MTKVTEYIYNWLTTEKPETDRYSHILLEGLHKLSSNTHFTDTIRKVLTPKIKLFTILFDFKRATKDKLASTETACDILLNIVKKDPLPSDDITFEISLNQGPFVALITCVTELIKTPEPPKEFTPAEKRVIWKAREILCWGVSCAINLQAYRRFLVMLINTAYIGVVDVEEADRQFVGVIKKLKMSTRYTTRAMEFVYSSMKKCNDEKIRTALGKYLREIVIDCKL